MAQIEKEFRFEAAHQLPGHFGQCAHLHGHSYRVSVVLEGPIKPVVLKDGVPASDAGMVEDFYTLSDIIKPLIKEKCDHKFLNETLPIPRTTAELIACWFFGEITRAFHERDITSTRVHSVHIRETESSHAVAFQEDWISVGCPGWPDSPLKQG